MYAFLIFLINLDFLLLLSFHSLLLSKIYLFFNILKSHFMYKLIIFNHINIFKPKQDLN